jgi:naphthalene 1,2-dioxygenase system ferredoxin subunit
MNWVKVAAVDDVPEGEMIGRSVEGQKVAIYHLDDGRFFATANVCTHEFALLSDGWLEGAEVECPLHSGRFDVTTGRALCEPLKRDIRRFGVEVRDGAVYVALPDKSS